MNDLVVNMPDLTVSQVSSLDDPDGAGYVVLRSKTRAPRRYNYPISIASRDRLRRLVDEMADREASVFGPYR